MNWSRRHSWTVSAFEYALLAAVIIVLIILAVRLI
jgi:hypothetical protein